MANIETKIENKRTILRWKWRAARGWSAKETMNHSNNGNDGEMELTCASSRGRKQRMHDDKSLISTDKAIS